VTALCHTLFGPFSGLLPLFSSILVTDIEKELALAPWVWHLRQPFFER